MSATVLEGRAIARPIREPLAAKAKVLASRLGRQPSLAIIGAQPNPAQESYLAARIKACSEAGISASLKTIPAGADDADMDEIIVQAARDKALDAIMLDFPLPASLDARKAALSLPPEKDAEGLSPANFGKLFLARDYAQTQTIIAPPTARAIAEILRSIPLPLSGKRAVVIGRSPIVGRPAAHLLSLLNMSVVLCHSRTQQLELEIRGADIVVSAVGKAGLVHGEWIREGAVAIDAGASQQDGGLCGDVEFEKAAARAAYITPVPGGVGPVTTAVLLSNVLSLTENRLLLSEN